jgi:hypothetical protein
MCHTPSFGSGSFRGREHLALQVPVVLSTGDDVKEKSGHDARKLFWSHQVCR